MVFGEVPYDSKTANRICEQIRTKKILNTERFTFNEYTASKEVTAFLREVLVVDPKERLDWTELQKHPLFDSGDRLEPEFHIKSVFRPQQGDLKLE